MAEVSGSTAAHHDLAWAHSQLLRDHGLQFQFKTFVPPRPPPWLEALGKTLHAILPVLKVVFWAGVAATVVFILYIIWREVSDGRWGRRRAPPLVLSGADGWRPTEQAARVLLADADRLAAEGRFAEAVHTLLHRSIEDIRGVRPDLVRPALTSRDIAALDALPASARPAFAAIAQVVERAFFGGYPVAPDDFARCRQDYEAFALPGTWR